MHSRNATQSGYQSELQDSHRIRMVDPAQSGVLDATAA